MTINIVGWSSDDKVPIFARQTTYGAGASSIGANPKYCLLAGNKTSAGSATPDTEIRDVLSVDDADAFFGAGSELAMMCYAAFEVPGVTVKAIAVTEAGGGAAAVQTITVGGSWTTAGTITFWLAGRAYQVNVAVTDTTTNVATSIDTAFNAIARSPVSSSPAAAVATLTTKSKGVRQKDWVLDYDLTYAPAGLTIALGGTLLTGVAREFITGSGADDVTASLATLLTDRYHYEAWAQYDSTNLALIKAYLDAEAGPLIAHLEHAAIGSARALATANTLSNTTINRQRFANPWLTNSQWPPSMLAAYIMALRSVLESVNPNTNYDGMATRIPPQRNKPDIPGHASLKSALNNGVTPLLTTADGTVRIVRGIVTHCKSGANFDYSTLDWADAVVPDYISDQLDAQWTVVKENNPYAGPDPADDARPPPEGIVTPKLWNAEVVKILKDGEAPNSVGAILTEQVDTHLPESMWDSTSKRILTACPVIVRTQNHQGGVDVRQTVAT